MGYFVNELSARRRSRRSPGIDCADLDTSPYVGERNGAAPACTTERRDRRSGRGHKVSSPPVRPPYARSASWLADGLAGPGSEHVAIAAKRALIGAVCNAMEGMHVLTDCVAQGAIGDIWRPNPDPAR
jgi:hypothetical protein